MIAFVGIVNQMKNNKEGADILLPLAYAEYNGRIKERFFSNLA